jgi:DNA-binding SARP family transcriptional activator/predicted ATPase
VASLALYFLGPLSIRCGDQQLPKPPTLKSQSLLAYLVLHRDQPQPRERLAGLFWGERPEQKARGSLSTALWHIRRCLPDETTILSDSHTVQFNPQAEIWLDVEEFEAQASGEEIATLQSAVALYRSDFLDGFYHDWIITERFRLETLFLDALARLMVGYETGGEHQAALATALRLLGRDPLREDVHRLAMRLYCELGQRSAALEQYDRCRQVMLEGLGTEPTVETTELYQAIIEGRFDVAGVREVVPHALPVAPSVQVGRSPLDVVPPSPLAGRGRELAFLRDCWQGVQAGQGGLVLISGEAGVGKTRLMEEFANHLRWRGVRVLWGRCYEFERTLPYQPFAEALRTILPTLTSDELEGLPAWSLRGVARLVPELLEELVLSKVEGRPELEVSDATSLDQERARLFDSVARFLAELSSQGALLVVLEDLQWASESALQLIHHLARDLGHHQVLMAGTFRPEAIGLQHPLLTLRRRLTRDGLARRLRLSRLSPQAVEDMILEMSGAGEAVMPLAGRLYQETEGNPFFLIEVVKALFETGMVQLGEEAWMGDFAQLSEEKFPLPAGVREAIQGRAHHLDEDTREALQLAAVLGREFDFAPLNQVWGQGQEATLEALDHLLRHRLIDEGAGVMGRDYAFTHHKIQEVVYASMPRRRRQYVHGRVGAAMESVYGPDEEGLAGELAYHFAQASRLDETLSEKAIRYLHQAGEGAQRLSAHEEAIAHLSGALQMLKTLPRTPERVGLELRLQLALGASLTATKGYTAPKLEQVYARAHELCEQLGELPQLAPVLFGLWAFYNTSSQFLKARATAEQILALARSQPTEDPVPFVAGHWAMTLTMFHLGEFTSSLYHAEQAIAHYSPQQHRSLAFLLSQDPKAICLGWAAQDLWMLGYPEQALRSSRAAVAWARELGHPYTTAFVLWQAGTIHLLRGEIQSALAVFDEQVGLASEQGFVHWRAAGTNARGWLLTELGQVEEGMAQVRQGRATMTAIGAKAGETETLTALADAHRKAGQIEEGLAAVEEGLAFGEETGERYCEVQLHRVKGDLLLMQGDVTRAEASFRKAIEVARKQEAKSLELLATMDLCQLWQRKGKREEARQTLAEIYRWFTEGFDSPYLKEAQALLAELS